MNRENTKKASSLFQYTKGYRFVAVLSPLFVIVEVVMDIAIPFVMGKMVDAGFTTGDYASFKKFALIIIGFALLSLLCGVLSAIFAAKASTGFAKNLRFAIFSKIQEFSFANIDKFSPGGLVTRLTGDVTNIQMAYQMLIRIAIRLPIMIITALVMSFKVSSHLALIYAVVLPLVIILIGTLMIILIPLFTKGFKVVDKTNEVTGENLRAMRVVKSYVREEEEKKKFDRVNEEHFKIFRKANCIISLGAPLMRGIIYACLLIIAYRGATEIVAGSLTTGALMSMFSYNMQILFSMMMAAMTMAMIVMSGACYRRIKEVLSEEVTIKNNDKAITDVKSGDINAENVNFSYYDDENKLQLKNINFEAKQGSVLGIVGPTGSGKTTLISLFARLYDVTTGALKIGGVDVRDYDLTALRDSVAVVLQKNTLFSGTIRSNMQWGKKDATDDEIYAALETAQIKQFVQNLPGGLDYEVEQNGANFSGGQKQRLCIARALLKNPKILVMDDSSSALDLNTEAALREALKHNNKDCTKVIISAKVASVKDADEIIVLNGGEVEAIGRHNDLLQSSPFYKTLSDVQGVTRNE